MSHLLKEVEQSNKVESSVDVNPGRRVTRSLTRPQESPGPSSEMPPLKKPNKGKGKGKARAVPEPEPEHSRDDKKKERVGEKDRDGDDSDDDGGEVVDDNVAQLIGFQVGCGSGSGSGSGSRSKAKTVVIERCTQCNAFKTRAEQVKEGLEKAVSGVTVLINPDKPRRGCFEIREDGGETFISLLDMKRPFQQMKDLDMEEVISDIAGKLQA